MSKQRKKGGPFGGPAFKSKWYILKKRDGTTVKVQGSYERAYAQYLIDKDIKFEAQPKPALAYVDRFGGTHHYTPDFWVDGVGNVEIKSTYTLARGTKKLDEVRASGHIITIYTEVELLKLFGIDVHATKSSRN